MIRLFDPFWIWVSAGAIAIVLFFSLLPQKSKSKSKSKKSKSISFPYRKQRTFFTRSEASFYQQLCREIRPGHVVFPKVRLWDLIEITATGSEAASARGRISQKHVDFVLCDEHYVPYLAIELDGKSHDRPTQQRSDVVKEAALHAAGLPLLRFRVGETWDFSRIKGSQVR